MTTKKGRKISGGKYVKARKKKAYEAAGQKRTVRKNDEDRRKIQRTRGGGKKVVMLQASVVNVKAKNKTTKTKIKNVLETPSNKFLARQNIITKGTILETELGKVRVTNRPTQEGVVNGILVE